MVKGMTRKLISFNGQGLKHFKKQNTFQKMNIQICNVSKRIEGRKNDEK